MPRKLVAICLAIFWSLFLGSPYLRAETVNFGSYLQEKYSPIEWQLLDVIDGYSLLISDKVIDVNRYDEEKNDWQNSQLKFWLNNEFYKQFSKEERAKIAGEIFVLSVDELRSLIPKVGKRAAMGTSYAEKMGQYPGNSWWWLRSPGQRDNYVAYVTADGAICESGDYVFLNVGGVRPALWLRPAGGRIDTAFVTPKAANYDPVNSQIIASFQLLEDGHYVEAIKQNNELLRRNKRSIILWLGAVLNGYAYSKIGNFKEARRSFSWAAANFIKKMGQESARNLELFRWLLAELRWDELTKVVPGQSHIADWALLGKMFSNPGKLGDSFNLLVTIFPQSEVVPYATLYLAIVSQNNGDYPKADEYLHYVVQYGPTELAAIAQGRLDLLSEGK